MRAFRVLAMIGVFSIQAIIGEVSAASLNSLNVFTSWIGNTYGTAPDHVMQTIDYMYVRPDGAVAAITGWDEGGHNVSVFKDGKTVCIPVESGTGSWGRMSNVAVTMDSQYIYQSMSQNGNDGANSSMNSNGLAQYPPAGSTLWECVRRFKMDGSSAPFSQGYGYDGSYLLINDSGAAISGLCVDKGELFVAEPYDTGAIKVYNTASLTTKPVRSWKMDRPGQLAVDSAGYLWMFRAGDSVNAPDIIRFSKTGVLQTQHITFDASVVPRCFSVDKKGNRILVSNDGPAQNILMYSNITTTPQLASTFGTTNGINSGTPGQIEPLKFNGPSGVGADSAGNIYVASNTTGVALESYTSQGSLRWQLLGLEFVDNASLDPLLPNDIFTKQEHIKVDYTKTTPGTEWSYVGCTLNRFKYPNDPRNFTSPDGAWIRNFAGKKFLILTDMYTSYLQFYRFAPSTDGETAIPCAMISGSMGGAWPPHQPSGSNWLWVDKNGNGDFDNGELESTNDYAYMGGWWVDSLGNIWKTIRRVAPDIGIVEYPFQGLTSSGVPQYSNATKVQKPAPTIFTDPHRIEYYPSSDRMYLSGYTTALPAPKDDAPGMGSEIVRFDNWSTANPTIIWRIPNPLSDTTAALSSSNMPDGKSMSVCGDYLFIASAMNRRVWVYSTIDGSRVGTILPGTSIGSNYGWVDIPYGIRAFKRNSGEYTIFVEDDGNAKVIMYRWCPSGNCVEQTTAVSSVIAPTARNVPSLRIAGKQLTISGLGDYRGAINITDLRGRIVARANATGNGIANVSIGAFAKSVVVVGIDGRSAVKQAIIK